ncbi:MAG: histidine kinase [Bacteroidota bacterium]
MTLKSLTPFQRTIVQHSLFWLGYYTFNVVRWGSYFGDYTYSAQSNLVEFPIHIVLAYFNLYYLIPKLLFPKRKYGWYLAALLGITLALSLLRVVLTYVLVTNEVWPESGREENLFDFNYILAVFIGELYVVGVTGSIKLTIDWVRNRERTSQLEKMNLETELAYLKSQVQPHFFFNTLNNLYSLTLVKSDKAPETVMKLSELMSYVIYQGQESEIHLSAVVNHIHNYLDLEKLRYGDKLEIDFSIEGELGGVRVAPLLLIPFVENAIKHGGKDEQGKIPLKLSLCVKEHQLRFQTQNFKAPAVNGHTMEADRKGGIGLANARRRLKLLYADRYSLDIQDEAPYFTVDLTVPLP